MSFVDDYVNAVADARRRSLARTEAIADRLRSPTDASKFLLSFLALRLGPLRHVPNWLHRAARYTEAHPEITQDLLETAKLERRHQLVLLEDIFELQPRAPGIDVRALIRPPYEPRIERHVRIRELVPIRSLPMIVLAIDLELAQHDLACGAVLLEACRRVLGPQGSGFLRLREADADRRVRARLRQLRAVCHGQPSTTAGSWANVTAGVLLSYADVLDACLVQGAASVTRPGCGC